MLVTGRYGLDKSVKLCDMRDPLDSTTNLVAWTTFLGWAISALVYCILAIFLISFSLVSKASILEHISLEKVGRRRRHLVRERTQQLKKRLHRLVRRM
ncbi:hypothetical protein DSO57_1005215 [Entomophthora muscae]|uniref:Uncharacterized protein n=2 Tax=Entomophthora muscae TaxID=34485 RepID=A0ACC2T7X6_9FUNG|nr:hypothetical protein DSO57_1005208 [Entomophthora muscae]KAJ9070688.1 hypothetical protein DSO57_1005215 [Entomophthora muscae]